MSGAVLHRPQHPAPAALNRELSLLVDDRPKLTMGREPALLAASLPEIEHGRE